jgi:hypothetical protein
MNTRHHTPWMRLAAAARRAPSGESTSGDADLAAPVGFSTRVVALAGLRPASALIGGPAFERLAARALGFACAGALAMTIWAGLPSSAEASPSGDALSITDSYLDPIGSVLEVVQL